jgi:opacity protein-like surface antigen
MRISVIRLIACLISGLIPLAGFSQPVPGEPIKGWYLGGGVAATNVFATEDSGFFGSSERGSSDTGFVINSGYRFNRFLAAEIGYLDGGEPSFQTVIIDPNAASFITHVDVIQETEAFEATVVGLLPFFSIWEIYIKGGAVFWDASSQQMFTPDTGGPTTTGQADKDGVDFLLGVGLGVTVWKKLHLRFEYQAFRTDDELLALNGDREARFDAYIAEIHWRFGEGW